MSHVDKMQVHWYTAWSIYYQKLCQFSCFNHHQPPLEYGTGVGLHNIGAKRPNSWGGTTQHLGRNDRTWGGHGADRPGADRLWGGSTSTLCMTPLSLLLLVFCCSSRSVTPMIETHHRHLSSVRFFAVLYPSHMLLISCSLFLPLVRFPVILPYRASRNSTSCRRTCPNHLRFRRFIVLMIQRFSFTRFRTSELLTFAFLGEAASSGPSF